MVEFTILNHSIDSLGSSNRSSRMIKSTLWDGHIDPLGWSNRPFTMIKSIIFFWPSTDDQFDYLEGCPIVDHHIWSARPYRYSGWPSIFLRVSTIFLAQNEIETKKIWDFFRLITFLCRNYGGAPIGKNVAPIG